MYCVWFQTDPPCENPGVIRMKFRGADFWVCPEHYDFYVTYWRISRNRYLEEGDQDLVDHYTGLLKENGEF